MSPVSKPKSLKRANRKVILGLLRKSGKLSIAELSEKSKLSKTTVMKIVNYYVEQGFVIISGKGKSTEEGGKKPTLYQFNTRGGYVYACHVFPEYLYSVITDLDSTILLDYKVEISENEDLKNVVNGMVQSFNHLIERGGIQRGKIIGIAIGAHGITDYMNGKVIFAPHFQSWGENVDLKGMLSRTLDIEAPIYVDNQIRFQVFAEKEKGIAKTKKNIIVIEGGSGLVAGIIVKDEIKRGAHSLAGEIGHMILSPDSEEICACGAKGCFEAMVTTKRLVRMAREGYQANPHSLIFNGHDPENFTIENIFHASNNGDKLAQDIIDDAAKWYSLGLTNLVLTYDPELIILQGVFVKAGDFFIQRLYERINSASLIHIEKDVSIVYSHFGTESGVIGGSAYVVSEYFR